MTDFDTFSNWLSYDEQTGIIAWRKRRGPMRAGMEAGCLSVDGYVVIAFRGAQYRAHRIAWLLHYGDWPSADLDHIDLNKTNNKIANLRLCDDAQNQWNTVREKGASKHKGVDWHQKTGKWRARIRVGGGRRIELGYFASQEEAAEAYARAAAELHGEFYRRN